MSRLIYAIYLAVSAILPEIASADPVATIGAAFDPFLQDTYFVITNDTNSTETNLVLTTSLGPITSVGLPDLAANASETYYFDQVNGGFLAGAGDNGVTDDTTYQLSLTVNGATAIGTPFSPLTTLNDTGIEVDFLGNNCFGYQSACPVGTGVTYTAALTTVATVPEPTGIAGLGAAIVTLACLRRRTR